MREKVNHFQVFGLCSYYRIEALQCIVGKKTENTVLDFLIGAFHSIRDNNHKIKDSILLLVVDNEWLNISQRVLRILNQKGIRVLATPSNSSPLNIVEQIWRLLKKELSW